MELGPSLRDLSLPLMLTQHGSAGLKSFAPPGLFPEVVQIGALSFLHIDLACQVCEHPPIRGLFGRRQGFSLAPCGILVMSPLKTRQPMARQA